MTQQVDSRDDSISVEYCGEWFTIPREERFTIGRDADLVVDDNPYLHRQLLEVSNFDGIWLLRNIGGRLAVTVTDSQGRLQSWLAPGSLLPLVFGTTTVVFTAGPTTYELGIHLVEPAFAETERGSPSGTTTVGEMPLTVSQKQLILALAEPMLLREGTGMSQLPTSAQGARRLGWTTTRFNRKLDNVCEKLDRVGVQGLRGTGRSHATNRRARLVEYALAARLVTRLDLPLLDQVEAR